MFNLLASNKYKALLEDMGIFDEEDILLTLPKRYVNYHVCDHERNLIDKEKVVLSGKIIKELTERKVNKRLFSSFGFETEGLRTYFKIIAFNRFYLSKIIKKDKHFILYGIFDKKRNSIIFLNFINEYEKNTLKPFYSLNKDFPQYVFLNLVKKTYKNFSSSILTFIPHKYLNKYHLLNKKEALGKAHFPLLQNDIKEAFRYFKYEEALFFSLKNILIRKENKSLKKIKNEPIGISSVISLINSLPFKLSEDQIKASKEIINDMNDSIPMYRLLLGDVGTGKTIVSFIALFANYSRHDQGALMAPTDTLARQHYENAKKVFKDTNIKIILLVGSLTLKAKKEIYQKIKNGDIDIVIGTHALFSDKVIYRSLGLVVIDEQHRFGVNQRKSLFLKSDYTDLLLLSATPIPRTLALSIFSHLDLSTLTSYPFKKAKIKTMIVSDHSDILIRAIKYALNNNRLVYIVTPLIEEEEENLLSVKEVFDFYNDKFPSLVGLLHGKMLSKDKEKVLNDFGSGIKPILVSTQVIEVGIDYSLASIMIIYGSIYFGLSSLHQLRGRIGRDGSEAFCFLTYNSLNSEQKERLTFFKNCSDGLKIAEFDLSKRGPGDFEGLKQSGFPSFLALNLLNDKNIFECAKKDAKEIIENPNDDENKSLIKLLKEEIDVETNFLG